MTKDQTTARSMYCRQCGYELVGLSESRCPECGTLFNAELAWTFRRHPKGWLLRRWRRRIVVGLLVVSLSTAITLSLVLGIAYVQWKTEQPVIAAIQGAGGIAQSRSTHSKVVQFFFGYTMHLAVNTQSAWSTPTRVRPGLFGQRFTHLFRRVEMVLLARESFGPSTTHFHPDYWDDVAIDDAWLAQLRNLRELRHITICSNRVTTAGIEQLRGMRSLRQLRLRCPQVPPSAIDRWRRQGLPVDAFTEPGPSPTVTGN